VTGYELCRRMGHPPAPHRLTSCLCGHKRYRITSMARDLRDLYSLTRHLMRHGL
jgi:hypothetical protein